MGILIKTYIIRHSYLQKTLNESKTIQKHTNN